MSDFNISNPHDKFFKDLLGQSELAADFLRNYLSPEVVNRLDLATLELQKDSFIDTEQAVAGTKCVRIFAHRDAVFVGQYRSCRSPTCATGIITSVSYK